jgi:hypothetical protein
MELASYPKRPLRHPVPSPVSVHMLSGFGHKAVALTNVSARGVGIVSDQLVQTGQEVTILTLHSALKFRVCWCERQQSGDYALGLAVVKDTNLMSVFADFLKNDDRPKGWW